MESLPSNATLRDLRLAPAQAERFARRVLGELHRAQREHGTLRMRLGITGTGTAPNYRFEDESGTPTEARDGNNHQPWPDGARFHQPESWSTAASTYEEVQQAIEAWSVRTSHRTAD